MSRAPSRLTLAAASIIIWTGAACSFGGGTGSSGTVDGGVDASDDGGTEPVACGGPAVYVDDFSALATHWNLFSPADFTVAGTLSIDPGGSVTGVTSGSFIDLTDDRISIEVPVHFTAGSGRQASFVLARAIDRFFGFHMSGDDLTIELAEPADQDIMSITLDRTNHRFLGLRESGGQVIWETSPDGVTWNTFISLPAPDYVHAARVQILAIEGGGANDPIVFDNLNGGRDLEPWCAASSFSDSFDDGVIDPRWLSSESDSLCAGNVETTSLVISTNPGTALFGDCGLRSAPTYRLTEDAFTLEVLRSPDEEVERYLNIFDQEGAFIGFSHSVSGLCPYAVDKDGVDLINFGSCLAYNPGYDFWRIRGAGTDVILEVSADQVAWDNITTQPAPFSLEAVDVAFGIYANAGSVLGTTHTIVNANP